MSNGKLATLSGGEPPFRTAADLRCAEKFALKDIQREEEQFNLKNPQ
jgi:hypothetical protein